MSTRAEVNSFFFLTKFWMFQMKDCWVGLNITDTHTRRQRGTLLDNAHGIDEGCRTKGSSHRGAAALDDDVEGATALDAVPRGDVADHDATLRRVGLAATAVNQEARPAAHVARDGSQRVAGGHSLEDLLIADAVGGARQRACRDLALAVRIVATAAFAPGASRGLDVRAVVGGAGEGAALLVVGVHEGIGFHVEEGIPGLVEVGHGPFVQGLAFSDFLDNDAIEFVPVGSHGGDNARNE